MTVRNSAASVESRLAQLPLWRFDTRTIVGSLLLGVAFSATMQITERLDQLWTGGLAVPLGYTFGSLWWPTTVIFFGLTGAFITSLFNPILAVLSATHPLAWSFPFLNLSETVPQTFLFRWHMATKGEITFVPFMIYIAIAVLCVSLVQAIGLYVIVLGLGFGQIITFALWQYLMGVFIGGPMGYYLFRSVKRSGVFFR
ncbi:MAG: hypothetical protein HYR94_06220 [Chloroflexi bacterium]|nr:hypothetical protein [Chloroflexota bacterium]